MSSDNHVQNCDNQVRAGGTQGGNFVHSTLHNPVFHIHSPAGRNNFDELSLLIIDPRIRPSDAEEELLKPNEKSKKVDEKEEIQGEIQDTQNKTSLCIREQKRIRIIILILLPQILIIIITIIVIILNKSGY